MNAEKYISLRREIHADPELSNAEYKTTEKLKSFLESQGLAWISFDGVSTGGYVRIDNGKNKTICFRADIDALPLDEMTGIEFSSQNPGIMHACGHDMHASIAAGLACELNKIKDSLTCNVVIMFQPAEEANPVGGAKPIIDSGFLKKERIDEIYGLHMWPSLPVGEIAVKSGPCMAASDRFRIDVFGNTSHAAEPHRGVDAVMIASQIDLALVNNLKREVSVFDPFVISVGSFQSEGRYNIISGHVILEGTYRTITDATRDYLYKRIPELVGSIAASYGGRAETVIQRGYGVVVNDKFLFKRFSSKAMEILGVKNVHTDIPPSLIAEDFSFFACEAPSLYFHMGCDSNYPLHSNCFLPHEEVLSIAIMLMMSYIQCL